MLTDKEWRAKEIFLDDSSQKEIFKKYHGYKVYWRCRYCGHWIKKGEFCNRACARRFIRIAHRYPTHFITKLHKYPEYDPEIFKYNRKKFKELEEKIRNRIIKEQAEKYRRHSLLTTLRPGMKNHSMGLLNRLEKFTIEHVLRRHNYEMSFSALVLGITRRTLYNKVTEYGIEIKRKSGA